MGSPRTAGLALAAAWAVLVLLQGAPALAEQDQPGCEQTWEGQEYLLRHLRITGNGRTGELEFELEGTLIASGAVEVPLFGPAGSVELDRVTERGGRPAVVSFNDVGYYLVTSSRSFVVQGRLTLGPDRAVELGGPLNTLEAELSEGRLVEGSRLTGLVDATLHFAPDAEPASASGAPARFVLDRTVRFGQIVEFEYVASSWSDAGVLRLPLRNGERVELVEGAEPRQEGTDLVLVPARGSTTVRIRGTLAEADRYELHSTSERSPEGWLIEADLHHVLSMEGGQQDLGGGSVFHRLMAQGWSYWLEPGQTLRIAARHLVPGQEQGAVVRSHVQQVLLNARGDVIADETLTYEADAADLLVLELQGRPSFVGADQRALPLLQARRGAREVVLPLWSGVHQLRVQSLSRHELGWLGGAFEVPVARSRLSTGAARVTVGLPASVYPVALTGGDEAWCAVGGRDGLAVLLALAAAWIALRSRRRKVLGAASLAGLWFLSPVLYLGVLGALVLGGALWGLHCVLRRRIPRACWIVTGALAVAVAGLGLAAGWHPLWLTFDTQNPHDPFAGYGFAPMEYLDESSDRPGSFDPLVEMSLARERETVALPLALPDRRLQASQQLVTPEHPFRPVVHYVTAWALGPVLLAWLASLLALAWSGRRDLAALRLRLEAWAGRPTGQPEPGRDDGVR